MARSEMLPQDHQWQLHGQQYSIVSYGIMLSFVANRRLLSASDLEQHTTMKYGQAETATTHNHDGGHISKPCEQASSRPLWLASACCTNEAQTCQLPGQTVQVDHEASGCQELRSRRGIMTSMATIHRQCRCGEQDEDVRQFPGWYRCACRSKYWHGDFQLGHKGNS